MANLLGFDTAYRLDRISGRYTSIKDERSLPRTVYGLNQPDRVDPWELVHRYHSWVPWMDALYGSADVSADGRRRAVRNQGVAKRGARPAAQSSRPQRGRRLALGRHESNEKYVGALLAVLLAAAVVAWWTHRTAHPQDGRAALPRNWRRELVDESDYSNGAASGAAGDLRGGATAGRRRCAWRTTT